MRLPRFLRRAGPAEEDSGGTGFDPTTTTHFQAKMKRAPVWFCSFLAGNNRERVRFRDELVNMKGAWPLLMKQRRGGTWTPEDKQQLKTMVRSASSVSPYLFIWALPGSVLLLPFLAWYLDTRRKQRTAGAAGSPGSR
ncbi:hypothetical protein H8N03_00085 [Ramlibacter sp. USB13]|uniref:Uncharacterized protein n=1 Tax=Ramlibacter cellulosilyticus TaxID=2764187 RepID=A0A923MMU6_9BURK|nr:hypothetical protein [Ramlibacter cellulosilyticus]MBC5781319.1 hypothetical protein [Ramlibacter cellulosilyticus]